MRTSAEPAPPPRKQSLRASGRRRMAFGLFVLGLMLAICAPLFVDRVAHAAPQPVDGRVSYRGWGALGAPVELGGTWRLTWLGDPGHAAPPGTAVAAPVPGSWTDIALPRGRRLPGQGIARLSLTLHDLPPGRYTLYLPITYAADRVFLDGRLVETRGAMGRDAATTRYDLRSHEISVETDGRPLRLEVELAAFLHRDSGFSDTPVFGLAEPMRTWIALQWMKDLLFHSALILLTLNALIAYLFRRQDRASLYLALAALLTLPGSAVISYDNLLLLTLPMLSFAAMLAMQYLASAAALAAFLAYARALFPQEAPRWLVRALLALIGAFFAAQCIAFARGDTLLASRIAISWPAVAGLALLGTTGIVLRAAIRGRDGAVVFLIGIAVFTAFTILAATVWAGLAPASWTPLASTLPLGMLMLLFSNFVVGAERWSLAVVSTEQINEDLRELIEVNSAITSEVHLDVLLKRIVEVTSRILSADRSTLLLHDSRTHELWSLIAEGLATREIRVAEDSGLAGYAFRHGEAVNVPDAYADARFNRTIDLATNYRTHTILTTPIHARDGRRLGVMQALNRLDGRPFDEDDTTRMVAFAAQAAIAIDNATLFAEVVASRNYNESILRSMSSGVVTIDPGAEIAKMNDAASAILGLPKEVLEGMNARHLVTRTNPWLLDEIDAVAATGERKTLLDVDMLTGGGKIISANITIVPLRGDDGPAGLLLLIEDISEGKRMQGAMRRFMTQKVVDQVLGRGDDLLFGTACEASILFADIRDFTALAEALSPRETVDMLNEAFTELFEAVAASDGVLDKFIGDAIMAVYGAPLPTGQDPENAVESAVQMIRAMAPLNARRAERGLAPLRLGVGVATGEVVAGTIGSPKRMDYTVIGDSVNLSARLQDLTKQYGVEILVCPTTAAAVGARHRLREIDLITVRGRRRPSQIFQVIPQAEAGGGPLDALLGAYRRGRDALAARDWAGAVAAFEAALGHDPDDRPSRLMLERARALAGDPPAEGWDGVWRARAAA